MPAVSGSSRRIRAASKPSMNGMRASLTITSGCCARAAATRAAPSLTVSTAYLPASIVARYARRSALSSAISTRSRPTAASGAGCSDAAAAAAGSALPARKACATCSTRAALRRANSIAARPSTSAIVPARSSRAAVRSVQGVRSSSSMTRKRSPDDAFVPSPESAVMQDGNPPSNGKASGPPDRRVGLSRAG